MNFLSYFWPQKIASFHSAYNGEIKVIEFLRSRYIESGGLMQSGKFLEKLYQKGINKLKIPDDGIKQILVLGLGGGSVIKVLQKKFNYCQITGVDIDEMMVNAGKKYLGLGDIKDLQIIISDANDFIEQDQNKYDLIFVDLYKGYDIPAQFETLDFFKKLQQLKTENGYVIFNRLYIQSHVFEASKFLDKLKNLFHYVNTAKIYSNLLICVK
ncbi:MAG: hypothetical protein UR52_C0011G0006 [Candidatus Gottesmanbacteria bacterium GW2011_GWA1_34_13]|uniref:PABS domain-containing protein n=1 Tax=Candidatus Gottesmanbacteria bacterium GW2011_GWA1_34_13 TaxID=1618434 RepID=A0A0G0AQR1_9BACT|nr:MAG: hypothetical protein UR52_C0011G0006 [Candidatus Gottesmanbacteria bacterium GW2011_GWA1_34_13]